MNAQEKESLINVGTTELQKHREIEEQWAKRNGAKFETFRAPKKAEGTVEFGGADVAAVLLQLTFDTGEKRNFNGTVYGSVAGTSAGAGIYIGAMPDDGEKWYMHVNVKDPGLGGIRVSFTPLHGMFNGVSAGAGATWINFGVGRWRKG